MIAFSILLSSDETEARRPPPAIARNIRSFREAHPSLPHHIYREPEIRSLLGGQFGADILRAYDTLRPFAYKADLARYCILHEHGGVYADIGFRFLRSWLPVEGRICVFRDFIGATPWDTCNGVIAAPPRHKALEKAIELSCANVANAYYGPTPLCPTGPSLFGRAIAASCAPEDVLTGDSRQIVHWPSLRDRRRHGLVRSGKLIALKTIAGGGRLAGLGLNGGNDYNELWRAGRVYGPKT